VAFEAKVSAAQHGRSSPTLGARRDRGGAAKGGSARDVSNATSGATTGGGPAPVGRAAAVTAAAPSTLAYELGTAPGADPAPAVLVHVTTIPQTLGFLRGQVSYVQSVGFSVHAISSPGPALGDFGLSEHVTVHGVPMTRRITPLRDLLATWRLWRLLKRIRPHVVHSHTPKGGLLGMIAAWLARTPVRVYTIHGSPLLTASGARRHLLRWTERAACTLAHRVLAVGESMRAMAIDEGLCGAGKVKVLLGGSVNGVDAAGRFRPLGESVRLETRLKHGIRPDALVIGFVGRLVREKGLVELAGAWAMLREREPRLELLLVGPLEAEDALPADVLAQLGSDPRVHLTGPDWDTPPLFAAMDVVALPTYREGFPVVPLEAAAMELPVVATFAPGCADAVQDGVTGALVAPRNAMALAEALWRYVSDPSLRRRHGETARRRVVSDFGQEAIWQATVAEYRSLLSTCMARGRRSALGGAATAAARGTFPR
jgi:glycosyltransferase involved in cell wall biosynthesis